MFSSESNKTTFFSDEDLYILRDKALCITHCDSLNNRLNKGYLSCLKVQKGFFTAYQKNIKIFDIDFPVLYLYYSYYNILGSETKNITYVSFINFEKRLYLFIGINFGFEKDAISKRGTISPTKPNGYVILFYLFLAFILPFEYYFMKQILKILINFEKKSSAIKKINLKNLN